MSRNIIFVVTYHRHKLLDPKIGTSSIDLALLITFYLKMETESSLRNVVLKNKQDGVVSQRQDDGKCLET
jgi:hypothetical protein